jgi:hypothetical protein
MTDMTTTSMAYAPVLDRQNELPDFADRIPSDFAPPARARRAPSRDTRMDSASQLAWVPRMGLAGLGLVLLSMFLALVNVPLPIDMVGMFCGSAVFSLANYIGSRFGQPVWIGPTLSSKLFLASVALACTAGVAGLTS